MAVYFIRNTSNGSIKIGYSRNPTHRIRQLQTATPDRLELIESVPGDLGLEARFKLRFRDHALGGEWFVGAVVEPQIPAMKAEAEAWHRRSGGQEPPRRKSGKRSALAGKFFHSKDAEGRIDWQGRVESIEGEFAVVQTFSWMDGSTSRSKLVPIVELGGWTFYGTASEMRAAYCRECGFTEPQIAEEERSLARMAKYLGVEIEP